jgi:hypothetical protein
MLGALLQFEQLIGDREIHDRLAPFAAYRRAPPRRWSSVAHLPNVRLSDFQTEARLTDALDHYKDLIHFDLPTTENVVVSLRDGSHRIASGDIVVANERLIRHVNDYTICRDGELIGAVTDAGSGG